MSHTQDPSSAKLPVLTWDAGELYVCGRRVYGIHIQPTDRNMQEQFEKAFWAGIKFAKHGSVS